MTPLGFWYHWVSIYDFLDKMGQFSALDNRTYLRFSGIVAQILTYLTVSNLEKCHIPFNVSILLRKRVFFHKGLKTFQYRSAFLAFRTKDNRAHFYSRCHIRRRLGKTGAGQTFFGYDNEKVLKMSFCVIWLVWLKTEWVFQFLVHL